MRVFVLLRSLFLVVLLTAVSVFVAHKQLCINYTPHGLERILSNCEESLNAIARVTERSYSEEEDVSNSTSQHDPMENSTRLHHRVKRSNSTINETSEDVEAKDLIENIELVEQWHKIPFANEAIRVNVRTCFEFSVSHIWSNAVAKFSNIVGPLRVTLILIVISFLLAILDMISRFVLRHVTIFQCLAHSLAQLLLWGYILVHMEMYRRHWVGTWRLAGQAATEIPMYPSEWLAFELHAFIVMMLAILEAVLFNYLPQHIRLLNSQGVYKCIQPEEVPESEREDCFD